MPPNRKRKKAVWSGESMAFVGYFLYKENRSGRNHALRPAGKNNTGEANHG